MSQIKNKILIIEDDAFMASLLNKAFEKAGLDFDLASDGETGLEKMRTNSFNLVVLDLTLPGISGYEVLKQMESDKNIIKIPVIILSNSELKEEIEKYLKLGVVDFLIKAHLDLDEIINRVKNILKTNKP